MPVPLGCGDWLGGRWGIHSQSQSRGFWVGHWKRAELSAGLLCGWTLIWDCAGCEPDKEGSTDGDRHQRWPETNLRASQELLGPAMLADQLSDLLPSLLTKEVLWWPWHSNSFQPFCPRSVRRAGIHGLMGWVLTLFTGSPCSNIFKRGNGERGKRKSVSSFPKLGLCRAPRPCLTPG